MENICIQYIHMCIYINASKIAKMILKPLLIILFYKGLLLFLKFFLFILVLCARMFCLHVYLCTILSEVLKESRRDCWMPSNWSNRLLRASMCRSSGRMRSSSFLTAELFPQSRILFSYYSLSERNYMI